MEEETGIKNLKDFAKHILSFQDVDDVLSGKIDEWLDLDKKAWKSVIALVES